MKLKRVLVTGSRDMQKADYELVAATLERVRQRLGGRFVLIHGAAPGADSLAAEWALINRIPAWGFPADWDAHNRAAGPIRNREMFENAEPDYGVAFPGGPGTADMVSVLEEAGVPVWRVKPTLDEEPS